MTIVTQKCIRKPLYVDAVRITGDNFDEIVVWCQGEVQQDEVPGKGTGKKYIKVRVHNPKNPRQTKAFVGDWLLYTERGYKVYTNKAFHASFDFVDEVDEDTEEVSTSELLEKQRGEGLIGPSTAIEEIQQQVGPGIEVVPATPENIAQAVRENEAAREAEATETRILSQEEQDELGADGVRELVQAGEVVLAQDIQAA